VQSFHSDRKQQRKAKIQRSIQRTSFSLSMFTVGVSTTRLSMLACIALDTAVAAAAATAADVLAMQALF
jgi:hypothetical protein